MINQPIADQTARTFEARYQQKPLVVRSPGRVNLIGEHTDYNEGFVLPAAIDKAIYIAIGPSGDDRIRLYAREFDTAHELALDELQPSDKGWPNYVLGVVDQFRQRGVALQGFNLVMDGDVPIGAGMSSSAAVECAVGMALNELWDTGFTKLELVQMAQLAEHQFAGVKCGIMDMFASMFGKKDQLIRLDCRSLESTYVPLRLEGYRLLLLNTNVKHSLASSAYNERRQQCEQGAALVREKHPDVRSLRDVNLKMLDELVKPVDETVYRRCRYVVEENARLLAACVALENWNTGELGRMMYGSHNGLSREYEVSCRELDYLVDAVRNDPSVLGARMMGGGFGGCTINIVEEAGIDGLVARLAPAYQQAMGLELTPYVAQIEDGTGIIADHR